MPNPPVAKHPLGARPPKRPTKSRTVDEDNDSAPGGAGTAQSTLSSNETLPLVTSPISTYRDKKPRRGISSTGIFSDSGKSTSSWDPRSDDDTSSTRPNELRLSGTGRSPYRSPFKAHTLDSSTYSFTTFDGSSPKVAPQPLYEEPEEMTASSTSSPAMTSIETTPPFSRTTSEAALVEPTPSTAARQALNTPRAHWEHVRQVFLPSTTPASPWKLEKVDSPLTPALKVEPQTPSTSSLSSSGNQQKPSRLARLGFRAAVEQASALALSAAARSFQDDIERACRFVRSFAAGLEDSKFPAGSSIALPLPQIGHQAQGSTSSSTGGGFPRLGRLRRPPSLQSMATTTTGSAQVHGFNQLQATLSHYAFVSGLSPYLPRQTQVLSALLAPFLGGYAPAKRAEDARSFAVDIFEFIMVTWKSENAESELERCLWCIKAATHSIDVSHQYPRLLLLLSSLLFTPKTLRPSLSPAVLQSLLQQLLLLQRLANPPYTSAPDPQVRDLVLRIRNSEYGRIDENSLRGEYGYGMEASDDLDDLVLAVFGEGVARMLRVGSPDCRTWVLHNALEFFWPVPNPSSPATSLRSQIALRRVAAFTDFAVELLSAKDSSGGCTFTRQDADMILSIVLSRIIPEASSYHVSNAESAKAMAPRIILRLFRAVNVADATEFIVTSWQSEGGDWMSILERELQEMVDKDDAERLIMSVAAIYRNTKGDCQNYLMSLVLLRLFKRLVRDPIPPTESLSSLLKAVAQSHPQLFFKPLFDCAKASQDFKVVEHLSVLATLTQHVPDLLIQNAEMISVALMGGVGTKIGKGKSKEGDSPSWSQARIGQCVIMMELLFKLDQLTREQNSLATPTSHPSAVHFFNDLETKLSILIEAREQTSLIPFSQRILLIALFHRIRLFTSSPKSAHWLPCIVNWASQGHPGAYLVPIASQSNPFLDNVSNANLVTEDVLEEAQFSLSKVGMIYTSSSSSRRNSRPTSLIIPSSTGNTSDLDNTEIASWGKREAVRALIPSQIMTAVLPLLVLVSAQLEDKDYRRLAPVLWAHHLESHDKPAAASACFLFMQSTEKIPTQTIRLIQDDLQSTMSEVRLHALQRLSVLYSWRHQILSQTYLPDRNHRRPFKLAAKPLSFVATDIGATKYVPDEQRDSALALLGASLPAEIRRRLMELNWVKSTEERENDNVQWDQLPLSVLPKLTLDVAEHEQLQSVTTAVESIASPKLSGRGNKLSRNPSSVAGYSTVRRRTIFVPALVEVFSTLTRLTGARDAVIAHAARELLFGAVRDDPALISRPMLEALQDPLRDPYDAIPSLHALLHIQAILPPTVSHHIFNHLAGYIKALSRDADKKDSLIQYVTVLPTISQLATHVRDLSVRDLRRNKVDGLLLPTFDLWFPSTLPSGIMFPQAPPGAEYLDGPPISVLHLTAIRTAQNMLLYRLLKRYPKEVTAIRKNLNTLQLPTVDSDSPQIPLGLSDFVPVEASSGTSRNGKDNLRRRSLMLSRSYLLLVTQLFRSFSRNLSDRAELARLLDGVNLALVAHGDDVGIVAHALVAFMTASTRFRRLFSSNSGFLLMMPAVIKVYCEAKPHDGIRSAIDYAIHRFFALHDKTFVFQTLDVISQVLVHPKLSSPSARAWFAEATFSMFDVLHNPLPGNTPDSAGIHDSNQIQEREALMTMLSETPEMLLGASSQQRVGSEDIAMLSLTSLMDKWRGRRFPLDDATRLLLTIIAHAPGLKRAENFLRLLGCWTKYLHNGSTSARSVLQLGVEALGTAVFSKGVPRPRPPEESQSNNVAAETSNGPPRRDSDTFFNPNLFTDLNVMRQEYILLLIEFSRAGGRLTSAGMQRAFGIVNSMLRDQGSATGELVSDFVNELSQRFLIRDGRPPPKQVVAFLAEIGPLFRVYGSILNLSRVVDTVTNLVKDPALHGDRDFTQMVISQFCGPALESCTAAAAEKVLLQFPARTSFVSLLAAAISLQDVDVIGLIERQQPSAPLFAGLILPLCFEMRTSSEISLGHRSSRESQGRAWVRLLAYTMDACLRHSAVDASVKKPLPSLGQAERRAGGEDSSFVAERSVVSLVAVALQTIKVIIMRAGDDIMAVMPGIWSRLAQFLQNILHEGDLSLAGLDRSQAPLPSPLASRPSTPFSPDGAPRTSLSSDNHGSSSDHHRQHVRVLDYLLLSIVEFITLFRSPLLIQMRLWIQERLVRLSPVDSRESAMRPNSRVSYTRDSRRVSSVFSKIRQRSGSHSPSVSPMQQNRELPASSGDIIDDRRAGYAMPASHPSSVEPIRPILHLGPISIPSAPSSTSVDSDSIRHMNRSHCIVTPELILASINRMYTVQAWFGYGSEDVSIQAWTRIAGLQNVRDETRLIVHEFRETFYVATNNLFVPPDVA